MFSGSVQGSSGLFSTTQADLPCWVMEGEGVSTEGVPKSDPDSACLPPLSSPGGCLQSSCHHRPGSGGPLSSHSPPREDTKYCFQFSLAQLMEGEALTRGKLEALG